MFVQTPVGDPFVTLRHGMTHFHDTYLPQRTNVCVWERMRGMAFLIFSPCLAEKSVTSLEVCHEDRVVLLGILFRGEPGC